MLRDAKIGKDETSQDESNRIETSQDQTNGTMTYQVENS